MFRSKVSLKEGIIRTEDCPSSISSFPNASKYGFLFHGRLHMFTQLLMGFCAGQIALIRHKYPDVEFNEKNYRKNPAISVSDKEEIKKALNRRENMRKTPIRAQLETEHFMRTFNIDTTKSEYYMTDIEELTYKMTAITPIGVSIFHLNGFSLRFEHVKTPVKGMLHYINIAETNYNTWTYFESERGMKMNYFCHECCRKEEARAYHRCGKTCRHCNRSKTLCKNGLENIYCSKCHITFFSMDCYKFHMIKNRNGKGGSRCSRVKKCEDCGREYQTRKPHKCEEIGNRCNRCGKKHVISQEWCTWKCLTDKEVAKRKKKQTEYRFAVYDMEAVQGEKYRNEDGFLVTHPQEHFANVIVARFWCWKCEHKDRLEPCTECGDREKVFRYTDATDHPHKVVDEFRDFILNSPIAKERTFFAHNASRYDAQMMLQSFMRINIFPKSIMDGYAIISMTVKHHLKYNIYFKDSYRLIPCAVADMPKNFQLSTGGKGTFPYFFNRPENYGTVTTGLPHDDFFGVLNKKKRKELDEYRRSLPPDYSFNFDHEIVKYCRQDVAVVQEAIVAFRKEIMSVTDWCPFSQANTVASYVLFVLVNNFADCSKMVYLPETGNPGRKVNQSEKALKWLLWKEKELGHRLISVMNKGEYRIPGTNYHVDGFDGDKTVYEVLGCYWHGCFCMGKDTMNVHYNKKMRDVHADSQLRLDRIRSLGYKVVTVRECDIDLELKKNRKMARFFADACVKDFLPLIPRNGVLGGRTENFRFRVVPGLNECIRYLDIVSLYPYVMYAHEYPLGAPTIITDFDGVDMKGPVPWKGLIKVKVLPPQDLLLPVLGYPCNNKLLFPLCRTCCEEENLSKTCNHDPEERALIGTFTHAELQKAVDKGYQIVRYYEVEASGWPPGVEGDEAKMAAFLARYEREMGIKINPDNMRLSPGKRYCAKLMLNTLWGKMCQRDNLPKSSYTDGTSFWDTKDFKGYKAHSFERLKTGVQFTKWKAIHEERHSSQHAALHHAAFVTSYGRLRLYGIMEKVVDGLMYCDTDSVMFVTPKDKNPLEDELDDFLGMLSNEIAPGDEVTEVAIVAPKAYMIVSRNATGEKQIIKAKGIQQNEETEPSLTIGNYRELAESRVRTALEGNDDSAFSITVPQSTIKKRRCLSLTTEYMMKSFRADSKKGAIRGTCALDARRVPYGYIGPL